MRDIHTLVVHWSATPKGWYANRSPEEMKAEIDRWHRQRGFTHGFGYHGLVHYDGRFLQGRPDEMTGAHALPHNTGSLGICVIAGPDQPFTAAQWKTLSWWLEQKQSAYAIADDRILGHRDLPDTSTDCPGFDVRDWWGMRKRHAGTAL